jgi:hypothetical protein
VNTCNIMEILLAPRIPLLQYYPFRCLVSLVRGTFAALNAKRKSLVWVSCSNQIPSEARRGCTILRAPAKHDSEVDLWAHAALCSHDHLVGPIFTLFSL